MNIIFGAGGFAREVEWLFHDISRSTNDGDRIHAFVASDGAPNIGTIVHEATVISESEFFSQSNTDALNIFLAVGSPNLRQQLYQKCQKLSDVRFPSLVHPSVHMDHRAGAISIGRGAIICAGVSLTSDINIGEFSNLNLHCTIGHDAQIGSFTTLSPGVHVSGRVALGRNVFVGTGAVLLENVHVCDHSVIGAGAVVTKDIIEAGTWVGVPARKTFK